MKITVDRSKCLGNGNCVLAAPEVFEQSDDDGLVVLLDAEPSQDLAARVNEAVMQCPVQAISVA